MSQVFDFKIKVELEHIDVLGHVNNVVYIAWMQQVAQQHSEQLGLGLAEFQQLKHAMVAVEHHVQYRKAAQLDDEIILRTWLSKIDSMYSFREYAFYREKDQSVIFIGKTKWACVEIATGRPKRLSPTFLQTYQPIDAEINPYDFYKL
ncbi:thioesterase family protein [Acinetobacter sp.]|uniref:acyl-CoA thioesterase n=1 Tax=Acinetobacter sp. TaxID=472 RepID=UPI0031D95192